VYTVLALPTLVGLSRTASARYLSAVASDTSLAGVKPLQSTVQLAPHVYSLLSRLKFRCIHLHYAFTEGHLYCGHCNCIYSCALRNSDRTTVYDANGAGAGSASTDQRHRRPIASASDADSSLVSTTFLEHRV